MIQLLFLAALLAAVSIAFMMYFRKPHMQRMHFPPHVLCLLRTVVKQLGSSAELQSDALRLMDALVHVRRQVAQAEPLPVGQTGKPRMFELAAVIVQEQHCTRDDLLQTLREMPGGAASAEIAAMPLCAANALCWRIEGLLRSLTALNRLPQTEDKRMRAAESQEALRQSVSCLHALRHMDWLSHCEGMDASHRLLLQDPAGVYPRMTVESRLKLRLDVERFCRHVGMDVIDVLTKALALCQSPDDTSDGSICAYFQDAQCMTQLHRTIGGWRGWIYARMHCRPALRRYAILAGLGVMAGFAFLQAGNPVFMLPFFSIAIGGTFRSFLPDKPLSLPCMDIDPSEDALRTLIVLPAVLFDEHDAIAAVRKLKVLQETFPEVHADYLLLGTSASHTSASQAAIVAAAVAISTMNEGSDRPSLYLHCSYAGDVPSAIALVSRMISTGESPAAIKWSNFDPSYLYRKFSFAFIVGQNAVPLPMSLPKLLAAASHPLCTPVPQPSGHAGHTVLACAGMAEVRLIRPNACTEALSAVSGMRVPLPLTDALTDCAEVQGVHAVQTEPRSLSGWLMAASRSAREAWDCFAWQLPYVQTAAGFERNPLGYQARFRLREHLRSTLLPAARLLLLLYALLTGQPLLCVLGLIPADLLQLRRTDLASLFRHICRFSLLPSHAAVCLLGAWRSLLQRAEVKDTSLLQCEIWAQGLSAVLLTALGILLPESSLLCLPLSALQACFLWAHRLYDIHDLPHHPLSAETTDFLHASAAGCWHAFVHYISEAASHLPPSWIQHNPELGAAGETCPEAIGGYLLSIVCAKEMGLISVSEAAARLASTCTALQSLPMPHGLPLRRYALPALTVLDGSADTSAIGLLYCACLVCAQALRAWLPELPPAHMTLSASLDSIAARIDVTRLYNAEAGLLYAGLDHHGQPLPVIEQVCDATLPLSLAACARRALPRTHLERLFHTRIRVHGRTVCLSRHGTAMEHLLAELFLPTDSACARNFIRAMRRNSRDGIFGCSSCACLEADAALQLRQGIFGLEGCAIHPGLNEPVFAPYAAALCLPQMPGEAAHCLQLMAAAGVACPWGFWDALDARGVMQPVPVLNLHHQAILLMALTHVLCGAPVQRYFLGAPGVEACLPLTNRPVDAALLPALPVRAGSFFQHPGFELRPDRQLQPCAAHILGQHGLQLQIDACGNQLIRLDDCILSHSKDASPAGLQCYLRDKGRLYRLGDASLPGVCVFLPGEVRFTQICGQLTVTLRIAVDASHQRALYVMTITNLSDEERLIDAADCLRTDTQPGTAYVLRGQDRHLALHDLKSGRTLHHRVHANVPLLSCTVCTDAEVFTGGGRTLANPASLLESPADLAIMALHPCLAFRMRFQLAGRAQAMLCLSVSPKEQPAPDFPALEGILRMCAMQQRALAGDLHLSESQLNCASLLCGHLMRYEPQKEYPLAFRLQTAEDISVLAELHGACRWLCAHGYTILLMVLCAQDVQPPQYMAEPDLQVYAANEVIDALLTFDGGRPLHVQLQAAQFPLSVQAVTPTADEEYALSDEVPPYPGGFDAEDCDYALQLPPGKTPPVFWKNVHQSHGWRETVACHGPLGPLQERLLIRFADGSTLSPWSLELPRIIRFGKGETVWEAEWKEFGVELQAAVLPHQTYGIRVLRLYNRSALPQYAQIQVSAVLPGRKLECGEGIAQTASADGKTVFIGGNGWQVYRTAPLLLAQPDGTPVWQPAAVPNGHAAVLTQSVDAGAHSCTEVIWLSGRSSEPQRLRSAAVHLHEEGASDALRALRRTWVNLVPLSINTPDEYLNRLMTRVLPVQCLTSEGTAGFPALVYLSPVHALRRLLRFAMQADSRDDWLQTTIHLAYLAQRTRSAGLLDFCLPGSSVTLLDACKETLLSLPLDGQRLPLTADPARDCFLYAIAAGQLSRVHPSGKLDELRRQLLNTADSRLWRDGFYGQDCVLRLDIQTLADTAYGPDARTSMAVRKAWHMLWNPVTGILRQTQPLESLLLPGMPGNGGMQTLPAAGFLASLLRHGMKDEAAMLLHSLNPLSRTDTALGCERFLCTPFRLPGGLLDTPMEAGRAIDPGGDAAAGWLYAIVLERLLGCRLQGNVIRMNPRIPEGWDGFSLMYQYGASTWHINVECRRDTPSVDGKPFKGNQFALYDDGHVHQLRFPIA